jgi:hypothetical protein
VDSLFADNFLHPNRGVLDTNHVKRHLISILIVPGFLYDSSM